MPQPKRFHPRPESVVGRGQACNLAASQPKRALEVARAIPDGWYRCQAMTAIAEANSGALAEAAMKEALRAASTGEDAFQQAAILGWPLLVALRKKQTPLAERILKDALALLPSVEPAASRAYALNLLWRSGFAGGDTMRRLMMEAALRHCPPDRSWRAEALYRDIAALLAWDQPDLADAFIARMPDGRAKTRIARRRAGGERLEPAR